ncbi:MAG: T9SS type A sorting domain-containing protein, partial [Tannerella sp.]|nr:T9SS type A sorting domain-containing protein [Tannerella sp.]
LSLPGENSLIVIPTTVVGGYGNIHENVFVKADGILAPGYASLMEGDCRTPHSQGILTIHNLQMEKDAVLRVSVGRRRLNVGGRMVDTTMMDMIAVEDMVFFTDGKVALEVLTEMETLEEGCYEFMTYGDTVGVSREYVKNLVLKTQRYGDSYFALDFSEAGKVRLCVTEIEMPEIRRHVDLPSVEGVTTVPEARRHYVRGYENFEFTATFTGSPLKVKATGFYSGRTVDLDRTAEPAGDNTWRYTIYRTVEPWTVYIGPEASDVSNGVLLPEGSQRIWTYRNTLYINSGKDDVVSIYNMAGVLQQKTDVGEGVRRITLERGLYVVTLNDGSAVHKIVIR